MLRKEEGAIAPRFVCAILLSGLFLAGTVPPAKAIGSNLTGAGGFIGGPNTDTGTREWINLKNQNGILVGQTDHELIRAVTVDSPGQEAGHLIVRHLTAPDGRRSMLLNASPSLEAGARVVTLFVRYPSRHLVLAHLVNGRWELHYPKPIAAPSIGSSNLSTDGLLAFQFAGLGFFWLLDSPLDTSSLTQQAFPAPSARELLGGGWIRALAPIFAVAFALTLGWSFSVFVHWTQRSKGN